MAHWASCGSIGQDEVGSAGGEAMKVGPCYCAYDYVCGHGETCGAVVEHPEVEGVRPVSNPAYGPWQFCNGCRDTLLGAGLVVLVEEERMNERRVW